MKLINGITRGFPIDADEQVDEWMKEVFVRLPAFRKPHTSPYAVYV